MRNYFTLLPLAFQSFLSFNTTTTTTMVHSHFPADPEWKVLLQDQLVKQPVNFFQLGTVAEASVPHVRTVTLRGFLGETSYSKKSQIPEESRNPSAQSDVFFTVSNAQQTKFKDLAFSNQVEAVFWIPPVGTQWRIRGHVVVIGGKGEAEVTGRKELDRHLTTSDPSWSWEKELQKIYDGLDAKSRERFGDSEEIPEDLRLVVVVPEHIEAQMHKPEDKELHWAVEAETEPKI
ncbi:pyridoxamine 5'-phosphate oxidase-domain-containing protein [Morchella snyderi]|nr:pyridoxamine 5'-phosphate oxidase-domain-containing protein [Morchella snyderi]